MKVEEKKLKNEYEIVEPRKKVYIALVHSFLGVKVEANYDNPYSKTALLEYVNKHTYADNKVCIYEIDNPFNEEMLDE